MSEDVVLPALGESVTEGTVTRWLKKVGDHVAVDEPLLEVSTDKVDTEIPSPVEGVLEEIVVDEDDTAEVGGVLARIGDGSGQGGGESEGGSSDESAEAPAETKSDAPAEDAPHEDAPVTEDAPDGDEAKADAAEAGPGSAGGDAQDVTLPALGESVTEGTVTRWLKQVGDEVAADEPLLEVSTDKVDTEIPAPVAGTLLEILVPEDDTAEVGGVLARIGSKGAAPSQDAPKGDAAKASDEGDATAEAAVEAKEDAQTLDTEQADPSKDAPAEAKDPERRPAESAGPRQPTPPSTPSSPSQTAKPAEPADERSGQKAASSAPAASGGAAKPGDAARYVTPIVRKLAHERGVDLATVEGTGVGGRIRKEDVLKAAEAASSAPAVGAAGAGAADEPAEVQVSELRGTRQKMTRLRKVVAERAVASMQATAQLTTVVEVDVTRLARLRDRVKAEFQQKTGEKLSFLPFFTLAAAEALQTFPIVNATVDGDEIVYPATENISMAVDTERGLLTPVVKDASKLDIAGLAKAISDLASRTRENKLVPDELQGGTFTVTNTGSRGALFDTPVVFLPQSAILGTGIVAKRPAVVKSADGEESIAIRSLVYLALSYDHRIIDGADAARFLSQMKARLEQGAFEGDLGI